MGDRARQCRRARIERITQHFVDQNRGDSDFVSEDDSWWHVFKVNGQRGRNPGHYFHKFAALPQGTYGYGKRGCAALGWTWEGEFHASNALDGMEQVLDSYLNMDDDDFNHVHVGVKMERLYAPRD